MTNRQRKPLTIIHRVEDIPIFKSEAEEHLFWATHQLSDALWDQAEPLTPEELPSPRLGTTPVVIQLDQPTLQRIKALARRRHRAYQVLVSELLKEQLEQEDRRAGRPG